MAPDMRDRIPRQIDVQSVVDLRFYMIFLGMHVANA